MPGVRLTLSLWLAAAVLVAARQSQAPAEAPRRVRFHHVHYRVGDPSAAMSAAASRLEGVRVIVPGLGVGVRAGTEYLLFDRIDESAPAEETPPVLPEAYASAVRWLAARAIQVEPADASQLRISTLALGDRYHHLAFVTEDLPRLASILTTGGARMLKSSEDAMLVDAGGGLLIELVRETDRTETFWCPMHPDVRSADAGKCPACGMTLVPIPPPKIGEYKLDVRQLQDAGRGRVSGLALSVREPDTNAPVTRLSVVHEKLLHLFVVSRDLRYFAHLHPEQRPDGAFRLAHPLPGGEVHADRRFSTGGGHFSDGPEGDHRPGAGGVTRAG